LDQDRTALLFLFFPSMLLILRSWIWDGCLPAFPVQLYQVSPYLKFSTSDLKIHLQFNMDLTLSGLAFVPLHWFGIARKHFEGERK